MQGGSGLPTSAALEPQSAAGKVLLHFTMSLDGFVAGPGHDMDWMTGFSSRPGLLQEYVETTGAILCGTTVPTSYGNSQAEGAPC